MEQQAFAQFVQGLTTEIKNIACSVTSTLRGEAFLKNIRPLVRREDGGCRAWIAEMNRYFGVARVANEDRCQAALLTTGGAVGQYVFRLLSNAPQLTWNALIEALEQYYGIDSNPQGHFVDLANVRQGKAEGIQDYMQRVVRLAERAYVGEDRTTPVVGKQVMNFFVGGLRDREIKMAVLKAEPSTLELAYQTALAELKWKIRLDANSECDHEPMEVCYARRRVPVEAMNTTTRKKDRDRVTIQNRDTGGNYSRNRISGGYRNYVPERNARVTLCWRCGKEGHIQRFCTWRAPGNDERPFGRRPANGPKTYRRT